MRRVLPETPVLPQPSSEPAGPLLREPSSVSVPGRDGPMETHVLPQPSSEPAGGPSIAAAGVSQADGQERSVLTVRHSFEGFHLSHEDLSHMVLNVDTLHPLLQVQAQAELDKQRPLECFGAEPDHGTWDGRRSLPSRSQHETLRALGTPLPTGVPGELSEVNAALARREYQWAKMSEADKRLWSRAAEKGWAAYLENDAVKILSLEESLAVRRRLAKAGELDRVLTPRFVCTDKKDGIRTDSCPLPPEPSARLVVPGFKDRANLDGQIRRDAPVASQHLLLSMTAWMGATWNLLSCDVKTAFLKGDKFVARELYISRTNPRTSPSIPLPTGCVAKILKGVFGLADAPRQWWLKLAKSLESLGWVRSSIDQACWFL